MPELAGDELHVAFLGDEDRGEGVSQGVVGKNIVIAGRVSAGKTTLLNALGRAIPGTERIVVCESSAELKLPHALPNCIAYEARPANTEGLSEITVGNLVEDALRQNPDRIVIGECRRGPETMAMLWALATGHSGLTSVHGESAEHALTNLARFALTSGANIESSQALKPGALFRHAGKPSASRAKEPRD